MDANNVSPKSYNTFGIELTHREELRKKQGVRLVLEEMLIDLGFVAAFAGHKFCDAVDVAYVLAKNTKKFAVEHKKYTATALLAILVITSLLL